MEWKLEIVRFDSEDVIATSGAVSTPGYYNPLPEDAPLTYTAFQKLSRAEKIQLMNELGEDEYTAYVLWLKRVYQSGAIEFGD